MIEEKILCEETEKKTNFFHVYFFAALFQKHKTSPESKRAEREREGWKTFFIRISYESRNGKKSMILWKVSSGGAGSSWVGVETMFEVISCEDSGMRNALHSLRDCDSFFS